MYGGSAHEGSLRAVNTENDERRATLEQIGINSLTRPYTRQHQSRAGGQGQYISWAGAVTQI